MRNVILADGFAHDLVATSHLVADILVEAEFDSTVRADFEAALAEVGALQPDLLTVNVLRWRMLSSRFDDGRRIGYAYSLPESGRRAIVDHLARGAGILALHGAVISFDDWPEWRMFLGASWNWDRSAHPEHGLARVEVRAPEHRLVAGLSDFDVVDEIYGFLDVAPDVQPLLTSAHGGADHPLLWTREAGGGRVVYSALGHDERSFASPEHQTILRRAATWAAGVI
jgi:type 1 glutamine amidotransferase